jgi:hypothetical protein
MRLKSNSLVELLMSSTLQPVPESFVSTRTSIHMLAEHVLCVARHRVDGHVGLQTEINGLATPALGKSQTVVAVEGADLVVRDKSGERREPITTLRKAAEFVGVTPGVPEGLWKPVTAMKLDAPLAIDQRSVVTLGSWFSFVAIALQTLAERTGGTFDTPTLWPEHFDLATSSDGVNYGGSPGDSHLARPYLYVGPHKRPLPPAGESFWNAPFGASLPYEEIASLDHAVGFFMYGRQLAAT